MASRAASKSKAAKPKRTVKVATKVAPKGGAKATARTKAKAKAPIKVSAKAATKARPAKKSPGKRAPAVTAPAASRYPTITPYLNVRSANEAIEFYKQAFGAEERSRMPAPDGSIMHAEITIGDASVFLSDAAAQPETRSTLHVLVDDCDALFERAISAGGEAKMAPQDMFWGDRYGEVRDPFGNVWSIATHKEDLTSDEVNRRAAESFSQPAAAEATEVDATTTE